MKVHMNDWASELWIRGVITQWVIRMSMTEHAESQHDPLWHDGTCPDEDNRRFARKRAKSDRTDAHSVAVFSDISSFNSRLFGNVSIKQQKFEKFKKHINITLYSVDTFKIIWNILKYKVIQAWKNMRVSNDDKIVFFGWTNSLMIWDLPERIWETKSSRLSCLAWPSKHLLVENVITPFWQQMWALPCVFAQ